MKQFNELKAKRILVNLSQKLQQLRLDKGFSQAELAARINRSRQFIVNIESGKNSPTVRDIIEIGTVLGIGLSDIISQPEAVERLANPKRAEAAVQNGNKEEKKSKSVLLYILSVIGAQPNIGETALYKLLYFIDFHYYKDTRNSITGFTYIRNHFGPTPIEFKSVMDEMIRDQEVVKVNSRFFQYDQRKYLPRKDPDLSRLTAEEKHHIDNVLTFYGNKTAAELSRISHSEDPWQKTAPGDVIDYRLII